MRHGLVYPNDQYNIYIMPRYVESTKHTKLKSKLSSLAFNIECIVFMDMVKPSLHIWSTISRARCTCIKMNRYRSILYMEIDSIL
jgi:hypothetical protein